MPEVVRIDVNDREFRSLLRKLDAFPKSIKRFAWNFTRTLASAVRKNAIRKKLEWKSNLIRSIKAKKVKDGVYKVNINAAGLYLDAEWLGTDDWKTEGHIVSTIKHPKVKRWARAKGLGPVPRMPLLFVKPNPFIRVPMEMELSKLGAKLKAEVNKAIR
jgi:hypothetical protein